MLFSLGNEEAESNGRRAGPLRLRRVQHRGERGRQTRPGAGPGCAEGTAERAALGQPGGKKRKLSGRSS